MSFFIILFFQIVDLFFRIDTVCEIYISSVVNYTHCLFSFFIKSKNTRRNRHEYASRSQRNRFLLGGYIQCNRIIEPVSPGQDFTVAVLENARSDIDDATYGGSCSDRSTRPVRIRINSPASYSYVKWLSKYGWFVCISSSDGDNSLGRTSS